MTNTERFFIDAAATYVTGNVRGNTKDVDFAELSSLSYIHKMTPVIYSSLTKYYSDDDAVKEYCTSIKKTALMQATSQVAKSRAILEVCAKLAERGIKAAIVKGVVLRALWPEPDLRISTDEDVLVSAEQFDEASDVICSLGFEEKKGTGDESNVRPFTDKKSGLYIELHNSLFYGGNEYNKKMASFFRNSVDNLEEVEIDGCKIYTLSPTDSLLYLILHSFKHFIHSGFGLRQLCDFIIYAKRYANYTNAEYIVDSLRSVRAVGFLDGLISIGEKYFGVTKAELGFAFHDAVSYDTEDLISDIVSGGAYGSSSLERVHSAHITLSSAKSGKRRSALSAIFPSYESMRAHYPFLAKHKCLLPAAWINRIVTKGLRKDNSFNASESIEIGRRRVELLKKYGVTE